MVSLPRKENEMKRYLVRLGTVICAAFLVAGIQGCGSSHVSLDTMPRNRDQAGSLANTVADGAGCVNLEELDFVGTTGKWGFSCQRGDISYTIVVFGDNESRQVGLKGLQDLGTLYVARGYFVVTVALPGTSGGISPSLLDPFR
jgi:hypothetical protein